MSSATSSRERARSIWLRIENGVSRPMSIRSVAVTTPSIIPSGPVVIPLGDVAAVGMGNGIACGLVGGVVVWLFNGDRMLGAILAMAMIINMFVAATAGTIIPLALRAMKVDPALASAVFITTLTDMFGFFSFLGLATLFIQYLHHPG